MHRCLQEGSIKTDPHYCLVPALFTAVVDDNGVEKNCIQKYQICTMFVEEVARLNHSILYSKIYLKRLIHEK